MNAKQKACRELIAEKYADTMECICDLWETYCEDPEAYNEKWETKLDEYGLSFDYVAPDTFGNDRGYWRYQLSWGGPSDEFRFYGESLDDYTVRLDRIEYWYMDWFDRASKTLTGDNYTLMESLFEMYFAECGTAAHVRKEAFDC